MGLLAAGAGACAYAYARWESNQYKRENKSVKIESGSPTEITINDGRLLSDPVKRVRDQSPVDSNSNGKSADRTRTLRILHISDIHLAKRESSDKLDFLGSITDDDYDLIFLTGDIFQYDESIIYAPYLISRRPRLGAYAVLGNHDYLRYSMFNKIVGRIIPSKRHPANSNRDVEPLISSLEAVGFDVLRDEARYLEQENLLIVGSDFPSIDESKLDDIVSAAPSNALKVALLHLPKNLEMYSRAGFDMAFCGHTHGGQVRVPGLGAIITDSDLGRREASGFTTRGKTVFHISRGLGADPRTDFRIFCPPEASVVELTYVSSTSGSLLHA